MAQGLKTIILGIIITLASNQVVSKLPYEVLDTIVELSDFDDFRGLNRVNVSDEQGPTRPIYRLDLDPGYVAYYEIDTGDDYVLLSSGPKTGDFREVESGPDPRPTNLLILQAQSNGQKCEKFFRLSPTGLTVCKNHNGTVVAASYNWTADVAKIDDWRMLDQMVRTSLKNFQNKWVERAKDKQIILDWATTDFVHKGQKLKKQTDEEALSPGSIVKVALGERFKSVKVFITSYAKSRYSNRVIRPTPKSKWQRKLCKVLVDVCLEESSKVNPFVLKKTPNNLFYLKLEINGNSNFVWKELEGHEVGFVISIQKEHDSIMKHFAISLHSGRFGRSPPGSGNKKIPGSDYDMPDYDQHKCCGCLSGCSPVAWAQVFGYYDRRARYSSSIFSPQIYGDSSEVAPKTLTREVRSFVEDIRKQVKTYCGSNGGATKISKMGDIAPWFRARQGAKARVVSYLRGWWLWGYSTSKIRSKGKWWLDKGYPVVFSIKLENKAGHSVVATKYRTKSRRYRHCVKILFWTSCSWKTAHDDKFYLHYGWGGSNNKWDHVNPYSAHVAYITK